MLAAFPTFTYFFDQALGNGVGVLFKYFRRLLIFGERGIDCIIQGDVQIVFDCNAASGSCACAAASGQGTDDTRRPGQTNKPGHGKRMP